MKKAPPEANRDSDQTQDHMTTIPEGYPVTETVQAAEVAPTAAAQPVPEELPFSSQPPVQVYQAMSGKTEADCAKDAVLRSKTKRTHEKRRILALTSNVLKYLFTLGPRTTTGVEEVACRVPQGLW
ncbi:uncharacterized protein LOC144120126 [Amblyomma americanum]